MSTRAELYATLAAAYAELARLEGVDTEAAPPPVPQRPAPHVRRSRVRPLHVCEDVPVDDLARRRAAKALARYPR